MKVRAVSGGHPVAARMSGRAGERLLAELATEVFGTASAARRFVLSGHVQGVGFRPFVYRLAHKHRLTGWVQNQRGEVEIIVAGPKAALVAFESDLIQDAPPLSRPRIEESGAIDNAHFDAFEIAPSSTDADASIFVPQDFFMCDARN
jgi:hydrogenase maturation protein HypF